MLWRNIMKMYDNILQKVRLYEEKRGIVYAKTDGKLYKGLKVFYILLFVYTMAMNSIFLLGAVLSETIFNALKNSVYTVFGLSIMLVVSLVVMRFKNTVWANILWAVLNVLSCVGLGFTFGVLLQDVIGFKASFYWRHLVPLCLMVIVTLALSFVALRAVFRTRKTYKKIIENLYTSYKASEDTVLSDEQWEEVLKNL